MEAKEALKIYLGGNMNTCSLKPLAIIEIMKSYAEHKCREQREADNKIFENSMEVRLSILVKAALMEVNETPLVTNN